MAPRYGRLYASAVLRPLAEQVVGALDVHRGETVCDLMCDGGTLGVALGAAVGTAGRVVLVDTDAALLEDARRDVAAIGCAVTSAVATAGESSLDKASCDRAASLCTLGFWDGDSLLDAAARVTRAAGCAAILTWDAASPPLHELALAGALRSVLGTRSAFLTRCLAGPGTDAAEMWNAVTLHDVVRFDGIGTYWAAMVLERPIAEELAPESGDVIASVRAACQRELEPCTAADGTMRIPVQATLYRRVPGNTA